MGKAKRQKTPRKKLEPNFWNRPDNSSRFSLTVSELTGNWLIMIDNVFCYDSALNKSDAEKVVTQLIDYEKTHPLPPTTRHISQEKYLKWSLKSAPFTDDIPAVVLQTSLNGLFTTDLNHAKRVVFDPNN